jgi:NAD(P)-dependent dehydrogenase (short-subunit alcohol dehydrogenase family)
LVTGSASGLGRNIAEAVLESGDRLKAACETEQNRKTVACSSPPLLAATGAGEQNGDGARIADPEQMGNGARVQWISGRPGEAPAHAGTDFIIARDGPIAVVYLFFDKL